MNGYTVFDLLADIISMLLAARGSQAGQSLVCLGVDPLSADMKRFRNYLRKLEVALRSGIQIPTHLYHMVRTDAEQCIQRGDIQGTQILLKILETTIGGFHENYHRMKYSGSSWKSILPIPPLNKNYENVHVKLYPAEFAEWMNSTGQDFFLNRYVAVTPEMEAEGCIQCVYVKRTNLQEVLADKQRLDIAVVPISGVNTVDISKKCIAFSEVILENGRPMNTEERIVRIAEAALKQGCDIIAFPKATVNVDVIVRLQNLLQSYSEQPVLLISPMYYEGHRKNVKVFGKNGRVLYEFSQCDENPEKGLLVIDQVCGLTIPLQTRESRCACLNTGAGKFLTERLDGAGECKKWSKQGGNKDWCEMCDMDYCYYEISISKTEGGFQYECNYRTA